MQPIPGGTPPAAPAAEDPFGAFKSEFNEPSPAAASNPYASPVTSHTSASVSTGGYQPTAADFGEIFSHAWQAFKPNIGILVGATVIVFGISIGFSIVTSILEQVAQDNGNTAFVVLALVLRTYPKTLSCPLICGVWRGFRIGSKPREQSVQHVRRDRDGSNLYRRHSFSTG
ncbi:hypothetical protein [Rhodopirellula europaea]|uniref:hypothetical protein n=1 Tax=Rhodopirellula europaea TaxID=1263866 RepID=UPI003D2D96BB